MQIEQILKESMEKNGSDLFLVPGSEIQIKIKGKMEPIGQEKIMSDQSFELLKQIYAHCQRSMDPLIQNGDDDFSFSYPQIGRFRCNAYKQRNSYAAVIRMVPFGLPDASKMNIPDNVIHLADMKNGMILVTGPAGSGKSTTLACMIDRINQTKSGHIITLEDPIEFVHSHKKCLVSQREIHLDTYDYATALRAALRQTPNTILLGEMRDFDTIQTALTAAETGQLLLSTLHTLGAAKTIDRIIDTFPANQQAQIRVQLSMVLRAVVSQQLLPAQDGSLIPVFEVMIVTPAIANLIREGKIHQIDNAIFSSQDSGMQTMDGALATLVNEGKVAKEIALAYAQDKTMFERKLRERKAHGI